MCVSLEIDKIACFVLSQAVCEQRTRASITHLAIVAVIAHPTLLLGYTLSERKKKKGTEMINSINAFYNQLELE